ncbi:DUF916 and DUF3324 domain-containing protein [Secundilactobacillus silagei]|uniref:Cell surface protein n=1 Tax=Secundilactobacillus silagei JCM 19001 TaxID=1302250 RepID=A0A1Z5IF05_9LACO|nr:DUF916 and DUF3324 domain-containing protein [Secundilactobacillus silagei]TDG71646.1 hypothetical protein C5L25_002303 [Secundilactobacillus silagei JCM 19001]GAX00365.1 cell surface protein [Secundilactobacillus silagei JCM 19001]
MKKLLRIVLLTLIFASGVLNLTGGQVHAKTAVNDFQVQAILPSDNLSHSSYFNLKVKPDTNRVLRLRITNNSNKRQRINVQPNNATTNENGIIDYSVHAKKDSSATTSFTDMLSNRNGKSVSVAGKSSAIVSFKLTLPKQPFSGTILGGFLVYSVSATNQVKNSNQSSNLAHYVIATQLVESSQQVKPNLLYHGTKYVGSGGLPRVQVNLQNTQPTIIGNVHVKTTVTGEGNKVVAKVDQKMLNFAPNSSFGYQLPTLNNKELKAGNYHLNMTVKGDNGSWKFDKLFTVTDKDGKAAKIAKPATNWKQIIMWVIEGLAILIVLAYIINKFRKWMKKD